MHVSRMSAYITLNKHIICWTCINSRYNVVVNVVFVFRIKSPTNELNSYLKICIFDYDLDRSLPSFRLSKMTNDTLTNLNESPDTFWFKGSKKNTAIEDVSCNALYMLYDHKNIVWSNQQTICLGIFVNCGLLSMLILYIWTC